MGKIAASDPIMQSGGAMLRNLLGLSTILLLNSIAKQFDSTSLI